MNVEADAVPRLIQSDHSDSQAVTGIGLDDILDQPAAPGLCPFPLSRGLVLAHEYDLAVLDIHAEATGEKLAVAHAYDGRINVIFGTHTHVPTADEQILPRGTGYITDVGMCGESGGILGMDAEVVVSRMRTHLSHKFKAAEGEPFANGAIFTLDPSTGVVSSVERIKF